MLDDSTPDVPAIYAETADRIEALLAGADPAFWALPVPTCPGWSVRDVVAHVTAVASDWTAGRLPGPPTDAQTAEHIRRYDDHDEAGLLGLWADTAARLVHNARSTGQEPPLGDIACHEHDIRAALGRPGARDAASVHRTADQLLTMLDTPVPLRIRTERAEYLSGPPEGSEIVLRTTAFESMRWRLGRRSRAQLAAMDWSSDPAQVLEHLHIFGPAHADIIE